MEQLTASMGQLHITDRPKKRRAKKRYRHWNNERWIAVSAPTTKIITPNGLIGHVCWTYDKTPKHKPCWLPKAHKHCCCNVDAKTDTPIDTNSPSPVKIVNDHGRECTFTVDMDGGLVKEPGVVTTRMPHMPQYPQPTYF